MLCAKVGGERGGEGRVVHEQRCGTMDRLRRFRPYFTALRPWTLSASLTPVLLGTILCYKSDGLVSLPIVFLSAAAVLTVHAAGNLVNTYFDYTQGVDLAETASDRTLLDKHLTPPQVVNLAATLYGCGMICLWLLIMLSPAQTEALAGLFFGGLSGSFLYTGGIGFKYYVLGDLIVIVTFGPLAVLFSYVAQCGNMSFSPLLLALPLALNTEAFIHSKHARDIEAHRRTGVVSLAVWLGQQGSYLLFTLLLFLPYILLVVWMTHNSLTLGLPLVTLPYCFPLERTFREDSRNQAISHKLARLNLSMGLLLVIGCLLARDIPLLHNNTF